MNNERNTLRDPELAKRSGWFTRDCKECGTAFYLPASRFNTKWDFCSIKCERMDKTNDGPEVEVIQRENAIKATERVYTYWHKLPDRVDFHFHGVKDPNAFRRANPVLFGLPYRMHTKTVSCKIQECNNRLLAELFDLDLEPVGVPLPAGGGFKYVHSNDPISPKHWLPSLYELARSFRQFGRSLRGKR